MDDESYFTLSDSTLSGNGTFYSNDRTLTPYDDKHYDKLKYELIVLVWLFISTKGFSRVHIRPSGMAINQKVYLNETSENIVEVLANYKILHVEDNNINKICKECLLNNTDPLMRAKINLE